MDRISSIDIHVLEYLEMRAVEESLEDRTGRSNPFVRLPSTNLNTLSFVLLATMAIAA